MMEKLRENVSLIFLCVLSISVFFIWHSTLLGTEGKLTLAFLDIGQGDSIYIEGPDGTQLLVDGGPSRAVLTRLGEVLPLSDTTLDAVIATHPDQDHIGGLSDVLSRFRVSTFLEPGIENDTSAYVSLEKSVASLGIPKTLARRGMKIPLGNGAEFEVLFPDRDITDGETNDDSIVATVRYGNTCFLLTGDAPTRTVESYILFTLHEQHLRCDVLKLGHHGSKYSSGTAFLSAVSPSVAVVSAGANNRYGHPSQEALARVEALRIPILSTIDEGTIIFESDGKIIKQK